MKTQITIAFLVITLAACAPPQTIPADTQNTAMAIVGTYVSLTQTALPTATLPPPTITPTAMIVYPTSSPLPTLPPPPIFTPDAIQVEMWREYQTELIKAVLSGYNPDLYKYALCEWDILGRSSQEVYVWAYCDLPGGGNGDGPTVIYINVDGSVQNMKTATYWMVDGKVMSNEGELFPADVIGKFDLYKGYSLFTGRIAEMINHLHFRQSNPEEPPFVVLLATPTATSTP